MNDLIVAFVQFAQGRLEDEDERVQCYEQFAAIMIDYFDCDNLEDFCEYDDLFEQALENIDYFDEEWEELDFDD